MRVRKLNPIRAILMERIKQDVQWGEQNHSNFKWLAILIEEVGEAANATLELNTTGEPKYSKNAIIDNLEYEIVQIAAVCVAWLECLLRKRK